MPHDVDSLLSRLVDRMDIDEQSAETLLDIDFADEDVDRVHELIDRRDSLSRAEQEELSLYLIVQEFLTLLHTKATDYLAGNS